MLLRYKPCWETRGAERKEGREEGSEGSVSIKPTHLRKKKSGVRRDEWSSDYSPRDACACLKLPSGGFNRYGEAKKVMKLTWCVSDSFFASEGRPFHTRLLMNTNGV